jgi:hypothetical protein
MNFNAREVPELVRAWDNATSTGWGKSVLESPDFKKTLQTVYGVKDVKDAPLMVQIDAWKKEVDGVVGEAVRAGNNRKAAVSRDARQRRATCSTRPTQNMPRPATPGPVPSKFLDAIEEGRTILSNKMSAEETPHCLA